MSDFTLSTLSEALVTIISSLGDEPNVDDGLTAQQLKNKFDEAPKNIRTFLNNTLIHELEQKIQSMDTAISNAASSSVGTDRIVDGAVTEIKLHTDAVTRDKIKNGEVTGDKIASGAITHDKLASDALYSNVLSMSPGTTHAITSSDNGKTFVDSYSATASTLDILLTLSQADSSVFPVGAEIALTRIYSKSTKLTVSGVRLFNVDNGIIGSANGTATIQIAQRGMAAIKKIESNTATYGDVWLLTGNVEVVT